MHPHARGGRGAGQAGRTLPCSLQRERGPVTLGSGFWPSTERIFLLWAAWERNGNPHGGLRGAQRGVVRGGGRLSTPGLQARPEVTDYSSQNALGTLWKGLFFFRVALWDGCLSERLHAHPCVSLPPGPSCPPPSGEPQGGERTEGQCPGLHVLAVQPRKLQWVGSQGWAACPDPRLLGTQWSWAASGQSAQVSALLLHRPIVAKAEKNPASAS